jgi:hypothetical protein
MNLSQLITKRNNKIKEKEEIKENDEIKNKRILIVSHKML